MVIKCLDCKKSLCAYKPERLLLCPFCGSRNIVTVKGRDSYAYIERAIPRMRELVAIIGEHQQILSSARKEYKTLYNTIKQYQKRGLFPKDAEIPLVADKKTSEETSQ